MKQLVECPCCPWKGYREPLVGVTIEAPCPVCGDIGLDKRPVRVIPDAPDDDELGSD